MSDHIDSRLLAAPVSESRTLLLKLEEAAHELRCTRRSLERQIAAHRLAVVHIGRAVRIERAELAVFLERLRGEEGSAPHRAASSAEFDAQLSAAARRVDVDRSGGYGKTA